MSTLIIFTYGFFIFLFTVGAVFVLYHLIRYSLDRTMGFMGALFFSVIFCILIIINLSFFSQLQPEKIFDNVNQKNLLPASEFAPPMKRGTTNPW